MPYTVPASFATFLDRISVPADLEEVANTRRAAIERLLSGKLEILEAVPMGSLMRGTGLRELSDLDLLLVLHYGRHAKGKTPRQLLEETRDHLGDYNARIVRRNGQSVTLYFNSWPNVDIVPAFRVNASSNASAHYKIPDPDRNGWIETLPQRHDDLIRASLSSRADLIKMLKTWNNAHSAYLESFHLEVLARDIPIHGGALFGPDWPWTLYKAFELLVERIDEVCTLSDPFSHVDEYLSYDKRVDAIDRARVAAEQACKAWYLTYEDKAENEEAIGLWCQIFGERFPRYG